MTAYLWGWAGWLILGAGYEVWGVWGRKAPGDTLSEFTAHVLRTGTTAGFTALMVLMWGLALWFPNHSRRFDRPVTLRAVESDNEAAPRSGNS